MKLLILCAILVGIVGAQRRDTRCPLKEDGRTPTHLPHAFDCTKFMKCHNGNAYEVQCPSGQHWNARGNSCDTIQRAGCTSPIPIPRPQQPQRPAVPPQPQRPNIPDPRPQIEHPDYLTCPQNDIPGQVVYFPYHLNCSQFYQCVTGRAVLLRCPAGTSWNIRGHFCDRIENVICATPRRP